MTTTFRVARSLVLLLLLIVLAPQTGKREAPPPEGQLARLIQPSPMLFEANHGQAETAADYLARGNGYLVSLAATEAVLQLRAHQSSDRIDHASVRMRLVGAAAPARRTGERQAPTKSHYYIGNDPSRWRTNIPNYERVRYDDVYLGIDLVYYGNQQRLEYDFVVEPGADPAAVAAGVLRSQSTSHGDGGWS